MYEYANGRVWYKERFIMRWVRWEGNEPHYVTTPEGYEERAIDGLEYV